MLFIQNNIIQQFEEKIFLIFYLNKPAKSELFDILLKKNMVYEKNAQNAANEKLLILFSLIAHQYLEMVIILNAKNVAPLVKRKNKEGQ